MELQSTSEFIVGDYEEENHYDFRKYKDFNLNTIKRNVQNFVKMDEYKYIMKYFYENSPDSEYYNYSDKWFIDNSIIVHDMKSFIHLIETHYIILRQFSNKGIASYTMGQLATLFFITYVE